MTGYTRATLVPSGFRIRMLRHHSSLFARVPLRASLLAFALGHAPATPAQTEADLAPPEAGATAGAVEASAVKAPATASRTMLRLI